MADHLGSYLDQLLTQRSKRPFLHRLGQCQTSQEIAEIVSQGEQLKADLIIHKIMAGKPSPVQCILAFFNPTDTRIFSPLLMPPGCWGRGYLLL